MYKYQTFFLLLVRRAEEEFTLTLNYPGIIALSNNSYSYCYWYHIDCVKNEEALPHRLRSAKF